MTNVIIAGYARSPFTFARKGGLARKIHERCHKWSPSGPNLRYDSIG